MFAPLAGGFKAGGTQRRSNSQEQKKAEEGPVWYTSPFLTRRDKSVAPIEHSRSHDCVLFGGRPAANTNVNTGGQQHE